MLVALAQRQRLISAASCSFLLLLLSTVLKFYPADLIDEAYDCMVFWVKQNIHGQIEDLK